jgi:hypothetical protein
MPEVGHHDTVASQYSSALPEHKTSLAIASEASERNLGQQPGLGTGNSSPRTRHVGGLRDGAAAAALRLLPAHHGREIHSGVCLPMANGVFAAVTASEDGTVRALTYQCVPRLACQPASLFLRSISALCCLVFFLFMVVHSDLGLWQIETNIEKSACALSE